MICTWLADIRGNAYLIDLLGGGRPVDQNGLQACRRQTASRWVDYLLSRSHLCGRLSFRKKYLPPSGETPRETGSLRTPHSKCGARNPPREKCLVIVRLCFNVLGRNFGWGNRASLNQHQVPLPNSATSVSESIKRSQHGNMDFVKSISNKFSLCLCGLQILSLFARVGRSKVDHAETKSYPEVAKPIKKLTAVRNIMTIEILRRSLQRKRAELKRHTRKRRRELLARSLQFHKPILFHSELSFFRSGNFLIQNILQLNTGNRYERPHSRQSATSASYAVERKD